MAPMPSSAADANTPVSVLAQPQLPEQVQRMVADGLRAFAAAAGEVPDSHGRRLHPGAGGDGQPGEP